MNTGMKRKNQWATQFGRLNRVFLLFIFIEKKIKKSQTRFVMA